MTRTAGGWSEPRNLGAPVNSAAAGVLSRLPLATARCTSRARARAAPAAIWRARLRDGRTRTREAPGAGQLGHVAFNAFVAPDRLPDRARRGPARLARRLRLLRGLPRARRPVERPGQPGPCHQHAGARRSLALRQPGRQYSSSCPRASPAPSASPTACCATCAGDRATATRTPGGSTRAWSPRCVRRRCSPRRQAAGTPVAGGGEMSCSMSSARRSAAPDDAGGHLLAGRAAAEQRSQQAFSISAGESSRHRSAASRRRRRRSACPSPRCA